MKRKFSAILLGAALLMSMFAGCTGTTNTASSAAASSATASTAATTTAKKNLTFAVVPKCVHAWYDVLHKGAEKEAKVLGDQLGVTITIKYICPTSADVTKQNAVLEQCAAMHVDGIMFDPLDVSGNKAVVDEIRAQGIKVICFDTPSFDSSITAIGSDPAEQSNAADERLVKLINGKGKVAIIQGVPTAPVHKARYDAHVAYLKKYPGITIVDGGIDNDNIQTAQSQAASVIAANPDLKGYLCCDASGPIGIGQAIKEANKKDQITAIGMDGIDAILNYVKTGDLESTSASIPYEQGLLGVLTLYQQTIGLRTPKFIDTGIDFVTKDNLTEYQASQQ